MRILTPTENKRFNELIGFVGLSLAVLLALSLLSYSPQRRLIQRLCAPARSSGRHETGSVRVGAHMADLLLPVLRILCLSVSGRGCFLWRCDGFEARCLKRRSRSCSGQQCCLLPSRPSCMLIGMIGPTCAGHCRPERLLGTLLSRRIARSVQSDWRAYLCQIAMLLTSLFPDHELLIPRGAEVDEKADGERRVDRTTDCARPGMA